MKRFRVLDWRKSRMHRRPQSLLWCGVGLAVRCVDGWVGGGKRVLSSNHTLTGDVNDNDVT